MALEAPGTPADLDEGVHGVMLDAYDRASELHARRERQAAANVQARAKASAQQGQGAANTRVRKKANASSARVTPGSAPKPGRRARTAVDVEEDAVDEDVDVEAPPAGQQPARRRRPGTAPADY